MLGECFSGKGLGIAVGGASVYEDELRGIGEDAVGLRLLPVETVVGVDGRIGHHVVAEGGIARAGIAPFQGIALLRRTLEVDAKGLLAVGGKEFRTVAVVVFVRVEKVLEAVGIGFVCAGAEAVSCVVGQVKSVARLQGAVVTLALQRPVRAFLLCGGHVGAGGRCSASEGVVGKQHRTEGAEEAVDVGGVGLGWYEGDAVVQVVVAALAVAHTVGFVVGDVVARSAQSIVVAVEHEVVETAVRHVLYLPEVDPDGVGLRQAGHKAQAGGLGGVGGEGEVGSYCALGEPVAAHVVEAEVAIAVAGAYGHPLVRLVVEGAGGEGVAGVVLVAKDVDLGRSCIGPDMGIACATCPEGAKGVGNAVEEQAVGT